MASSQSEPAMKLIDIDWPKVVSFTFPGLILAASVYMVVDVISDRDITATALVGDPAVLSASIASLAALATFLGLFLDAFGHVFFEEVVEHCLQRFIDIAADREARISGYTPSPGSFDGIYRVKVDKDLRQEQTDSHYRYAEFSINSAVALVVLTLVFPLYLLVVVQFGFVGSFLVALATAAFTGTMSYVAVHSLVEWERVRNELVFGTLDSGETGAEPGEA